jgi:hypothetical protein
VRQLAASLCLLVVTIVATACGGSSAGTGSQTAVAPVPTRTQTATAPVATTYHTHLERDLAHAFAAALLATPAAPTESQIPPKIKLLLREPPTVCSRQRSGTYRCSLDYQLPKGPPMHVRYAVHRDRNCFTATAAAIGAASTLHRLVNC